MTSKYSRLRLKKRTSINSISVFHKEKEMADFRKWFFALAALALMLGASTAYAQITNSNSVTCNTTPSNPTIVRVEGLAELVGDYVLVCTGGTPTPAPGTVAGPTQTIPQFDVTLTLNANITSRLLSGGYIDALLTVDEPFPATPFPTNATRQSGSPIGQNVCYSNTTGLGSTPANCNVLNGTYNPNNFTFSGSPYAPFNVFVAHQASVSQVTWLGVPIDGPGTAGSRVLRMTNIRANACLVGLSSTLVPSSIVGFVSLNGSNSVVIQGSGQQTLAYVQTGLIVGGGNTTLQQCVNLNTGGGGLAGNFTTSTGQAVTNVSVTEGFAAAFKTQTATAAASITGVNDVTTPAVFQNVPGVNYSTESGLEVPPSTPPGGGSPYVFGLANSGTRILLVFNNVGTGASIVLPQYVALTLAGGLGQGFPAPPSNPAGLASGWTGGFLQLVGVGTDLNGNTGIAPTASAAFNNNFLPFFTSAPFKGTVGVTAPFNAGVTVGVNGGVATAVYEVANADATAIESANIPVGVSYVSNTGNNLPATGQATVTASFAPLSTSNTATATDPIPRFCNKSTARNTFNINLCTCNLLFPFVTQQSGFDTGIAIANTSLDVYGTSPQSGSVTLTYFGNTTGGGAAPAAQTSAAVAGGTELVFTLSNGGDHGIAAVPGFQGYIIAQAKFEWCHGFAFISDLGAQKLAEGYLAIELDIYGGSGLNRTGITGEVQGH
jgi:hypothetical protein